MVPKEAHYSNSTMETPSSSPHQIHQPSSLTHTLLSLLVIKSVYPCAVKGSHFPSIPLSTSSISASTSGHTTLTYICPNTSSFFFFNTSSFKRKNLEDNLEEMGKFLEMYNLPNLNHKEIENLNRLIISKEIESII